MKILASETTSFRLQADFKDNATRGLKRINRELNKVLNTYRKIGRVSKQISRDMNRLNRAFDGSNRGLTSQSNSFRQGTREMSRYTREMRRAISTQRQFQRVSGGVTPSAPTGGGFIGGVSQIAVGNMIASAATKFIGTMFDVAKSAMRIPVQYFKSQFQASLDDEMSDLASAGGIFAIGKRNRVPWADSLAEATKIQKDINLELSKVAAGLPGATEDYVRNSKKITDTTMGIFKDAEMSANSMRAIREALGVEAKTSVDAFKALNIELAKLATIADISGGIGAGAISTTEVMEQIINDEKFSLKALKSRYKAVRNNSTLQQALQENSEAISSTMAGSGESMLAVRKAFTDAYPEEVLKAMTESVGGTIEAIRSNLFGLESGLFGFRRKIKGLETSFFDVFGDIITSLGMVALPVFELIQDLFDPMKELVKPLLELRGNALATASNFRFALREFKDITDGTKTIRASIYAIARLARAWGADVDNILANVETADPGQLLMGVVGRLMGSEMMQRLGEAIGGLIGSMLSMVAKLFSGVSGDVAGFGAGFMKSFTEQGGLEAIDILVSNLVRGLLFVAGQVLKQIVSNIPTIVGASFEVAPIFTGITLLFSGLMAIATIASTISTIVAAWTAIVPVLTAVGTAITTVVGVIGSVVAGIGAIPVATGLVVVALVAAIYIFRDRIGSFIKQIGQILINTLRAIPQAFRDLVATFKAQVSAIKGLFDGIKGKVDSVRGAIDRGLGALKNLFNFRLPGMGRNRETSEPTAGNAYSGVISKQVGLMKAYNKEMSMAPSGANPVMANSSELIIPTRANGQGSVKGITDGLFNIETQVKNNIVATREIKIKIDETCHAIKNCIYEQTHIITAQSAITHQKLDYSAQVTRTGFSHLSEVVNGLSATIKSEGSQTRKDIAGLMSKVASMASIGGGEGLGALAGPGGKIPTFGEALQKGIAATQKFTGRANMCAATVKEYIKAVGLNSDAMDWTADSAKRMGTVMTDFSKLQPGDIIGWSGGPQFGDEHVGIYQGGQKVLHQSSKAGLKFGSYDHLNYFKSQRGAYFVRPNYMGNVSPLIQEMRNKPKGSQLTVANSSEFIATKGQTKMLASALQGSGGGANVTVNINGFNGSSEELAKKVVYHIETAMNKGRQNSIV